MMVSRESMGIISRIQAHILHRFPLWPDWSRGGKRVIHWVWPWLFSWRCYNQSGLWAHPCIWGQLTQEKPFPMDVDKVCFLCWLLGDVLGQCPLLIHILDEGTSNIASTPGLSHDVIDSSPEALVLLTVDYGQYLLVPLFILTLPCSL
jgi:hypothetical protein